MTNSAWEILPIRLKKSNEFIMIPLRDNSIVILNESNSAQIIESSGMTQTEYKVNTGYFYRYPANIAPFCI